MSATITTTDPAEKCFYAIGMATTATELRAIEKTVPEITTDPDEQAELINAILDRFSVLNGIEVGEQKPRWN